MPTTQKPQQKQTKATQKVGGSAKKPVTKAMEGGKSKVATVKSKTVVRGGSARGGASGGVIPKLYEDTKNRSKENESRINNIDRRIDVMIRKMNDKYKKLNTQIEAIFSTLDEETKEKINVFLNRSGSYVNTSGDHMGREYLGDYIIDDVSEIMNKTYN